MTSPAQQASEVQYRLALIVPQSCTLLVESVSGRHRLPQVSIPRWNRPAEQITQALRLKWDMRSIVLDFLHDDQTAPLAVIEVRSPRESSAENLLPVAPADIGDHELSEKERVRILDILTGNTPSDQPFSRLGWLDEAQEWIRECVGTPIEFVDDVRQLNASGAFALIRLATRQGPAYWLKATGDPNRHEFAITTTLSELFPRYLPPLIAQRSDWNAWVVEDCGPSLRDSFTLPHSKDAITQLARLQIESIRSIDSLVQAGCPRPGIAILEEHLDEMFEYLETAMEQQTSTQVPRLSPSRLHELRSLLSEACSEMQGVGIPDTLIHRDLNPGNVLVGGPTCAFVDWAEGAIGNPVLTCKQFQAHIARYGEEAQSWLPSLLAAYRQQWQGFLSTEQLDTALTLSPMLSVASCLYGRGTWLHSPDAHNPQSQAYRRSLARHMDRAAQDLEQARVSW